MKEKAQASLQAFTIVELLIVIVVIAILAAISVVAYTGIQARAYDSSVKSDLSSFSKKMELARADSGYTYYPYGNGTTDNDGYNYNMLEFRVNRNAYAIMPDVQINLLVCHNASTGVFGMLATSKSGKRFYVTKGGNISEYTGGVSWADSNYSAQCASVLSGTNSGGAGYNAVWRAWAAA